MESIALKSLIIWKTREIVKKQHLEDAFDRTGTEQERKSYLKHKIIHKQSLIENIQLEIDKEENRINLL